MDMLATMKFVRGAVSTKNLVPELKHFTIRDGYIKAFNGVISLCSPIDFSVNCIPLAEPLVKALMNCDDVMSLGMTPANRLRVQSGKFKAFIECVDVELPLAVPAGEIIPIDGKQLMKAIHAVLPFIGSDASRPWVNGVLLRGKSAFATNNVCLVEYWIGTEFPLTANIPIEAVREMVRIDSPPDSIQISDHSITFHYPDDRWLLTQLYGTDWPDLTRILDRPSSPVPVAKELFIGLDYIKPFLDKSGNVYLKDGYASTHELETNLGAAYAVDGMTCEGIYKLEMLKLLEIATHADLTAYPDPCMWFGDHIRGAIIGLRP
jgi:hypothetical protein